MKASSQQLEQNLDEILKTKNMSSTNNIRRFAKNIEVKERLDYIVESDDIFACKNVHKYKLSKNICIHDIVQANSVDDDKNTISCYLYILTLFAYLYNTIIVSSTNEDTIDIDDDEVSTNFENIVEAIKHIQQEEPYQEKITNLKDNVVLVLLSKISNLYVKGTVISDEDDYDIPDDPEKLMNNTKIGSLAKEISQEIDLSQLKIEKPEDIMANLMGGENNIINNIVSKVGSKLHEKIDKGEIKHEDLISEAISMMGMLNKGGAGGLAGGLMQNPMFAGMMKNFGKGFQVNTGKVRAASTRDKLRKKLEEKKKSNIL